MWTAWSQWNERWGHGRNAWPRCLVDTFLTVGKCSGVSDLEACKNLLILQGTPCWPLSPSVPFAAILTHRRPPAKSSAGNPQPKSVPARCNADSHTEGQYLPGGLGGRHFPL